MPSPTHIIIGGKRWKLRWVRSIDSKDAEACGECDRPDTKGKEIRIKRGLPPLKELDTLIHEALHAADWNAAEEWVHETATDLARMLTKLGWRRDG